MDRVYAIVRFGLCYLSGPCVLALLAFAGFRLQGRFGRKPVTPGRLLLLLLARIASVIYLADVPRFPLDMPAA